MFGSRVVDEDEDDGGAGGCWSGLLRLIFAGVCTFGSRVVAKDEDEVHRWRLTFQGCCGMQLRRLRHTAATRSVLHASLD